MAEAKLNEGKTEVREVVISEPTITLTLSIAEAEVVRSMMGSVNLYYSDIHTESKGIYDAVWPLLHSRLSQYRAESIHRDAVIWKRKYLQ